MSRSATTPVSCSIRSASVDLPWSMWAMMQKFRICAGAVKVWSAKLLMGISWSGSYSARRAPLCGPSRLQRIEAGPSRHNRALSLHLCCETWPRSGRRSSGLSTSQRTWCSTRRPGSSAAAAARDAAARHPAGHQDRASTPSPARPTTRPPPSPRAARSPTTAFPPRSGPAGWCTRPISTAAPIPARVVWTWVVYEDDPSRGKDRPVSGGRPRPSHPARLDAVQPGTPPERPRVGRYRFGALGLRGPARAGCGWTGCSTCPRRASAAKARSWSARRSRSSRRGCARDYSWS